MYSNFSMKCISYIKSDKYLRTNRIYYFTHRFKSNNIPPDDEKNKKTQAVNKLNDLLKSMAKGNDVPKSAIPIDLAKPRQIAKQAELGKKKIKVEEKQLEDQLVEAAHSVAESIGGDIKQTESELLNLLKIYSDETIVDNEKKPKSSVHLSELISGMKIDCSKPATNKYPEVDKAQRVRESLNRFTKSQKSFEKFKYYRKPMQDYTPLDIFGGEPLNIFKDPLTLDKNGITLSTWDHLHKKSLKLAITHPPKNIYEQMIMWTEEGKLWKFPINNEQGMENENEVFFADHVFLEPLIEDWCPNKGPIRHFMELVCVGLSKNPYLSVEEKRDHINWFRQYFYEKNQLLKEVGAFEIKSLPENIKEYYQPPVPKT
ncbi:28S ribosomal protein S31, mitochondrial [Daktulosphaira vitifoliae]|uniref:28S ribosomal protein S31, mitochondrial n=1 Tax=Daktulosphaira vitifoliae TaxID=58002 RepID=UPI0021AA2D94|nr:28S ribosomal protein S31, mitochondrial [Daktulosphaira vitifoliae]